MLRLPKVSVERPALTTLPCHDCAVDYHATNYTNVQLSILGIEARSDRVRMDESANYSPLLPVNLTQATSVIC